MSERGWYTPSGAAARLLKWAARHAPDGPNIFLAGCYGVVEVFGISHVLIPAITTMLRATAARLHEKKQSTNLK